jgi:hypothetical protein
MEEDEAAERISLTNQIEDIRRDIDQMNSETSVFEDYYADRYQKVEEEENRRNLSSKNKKQRVTRSTPNLLLANQKYEVSNAVNESILKEIEARRKTSEKMVDTLRAVLEETEIRIGNLKRDAYEFKRDVVVGAENPQTGKLQSETVVKFFEDKWKRKDVMIDKLRLKNRTLKAAITKAEMQLTQTEEVGDVLHYIDFHQLQIENKQFVAKIEERNDELLFVKLSTGKTIKCLNELKSNLNELTSELNDNNDMVVERREGLDDLKKEKLDVMKEIRTEKKSQNRLRQSIEDAAAMPNIEEYIDQKKQMYECDVVLRNTAKKIDIAEMAAQKSRRKLMQSGTFKSSKSLTGF